MRTCISCGEELHPDQDCKCDKCNPVSITQPARAVTPLPNKLEDEPANLTASTLMMYELLKALNANTFEALYQWADKYGIELTRERALMSTKFEAIEKVLRAPNSP